MTNHTFRVSDIIEVLAGQTHPRHGRELSVVLSERVGFPVTPHLVNQVLYALSWGGLVRMHADICWSLAAPSDAVSRAVGSHVFNADANLGLAEIRRTLFPSKSRKSPVSGAVGHWIFSFELDAKSASEARRRREIWSFECQLCGSGFTMRPNRTGYILPFTGPARLVRRNHDRKLHPKELTIQAELEALLVGLEVPSDLMDV